MQQKLSLYLADFLVQQGITACFTITGGGAMHLNDAFGHQAGMRCLYHHHEQACAIAAEGYARHSGKPALTCVTTGPGGTNALTGVMGSWVDSIPMLVISGQVKREETISSTPIPLRQLGDQEFNIIDVARHMTKYAVMIADPAEIAYHVEKALYLAQNGRPGPVWLDIPLDVQGAAIDPDTLRHFDPAEIDLQAGGIAEETARDILARIAAAKRPVLLAGSAVVQSGARDAFVLLAEKLQIPVLTAWGAHDTLWSDHPLFCGKPGTMGTRGGNFVAQNADLLLSIGCRLNLRMIGHNKHQFAKDAYQIVVDIDKAELEKPTLRPNMPIHADLRQVIARLLPLAYAPSAAHPQWLAWCRAIDAKYPPAKPEWFLQEAPLNPYVLMDIFFRALPAGESVVCSNGTACVTGQQAAIATKGMRQIVNSGCASMGYGLPAAIGASIAAQNKRVFCLDGDGSFQMNLQELQTVVHHQMNLKILVVNNNGYHSIRQTQRNYFQPPLVGVSPDSGISFPSLEKLAYAYDIPYLRIDSISSAKEAMTKMLSMEGPVLCEAMVDPDQNFEPKISSKVLPDGRIVSTELDDMFPFLPRDEYDANHIV